MVRCLLVCFILLSHLIAKGQNTIFLTNGESIDYQSYKIKGSVISIKTTSGTIKRSGTIENILGFFSSKEDKFFHRKKIDGGYRFIERITDGYINIYEHVIIRSPSTGPYENYAGPSYLWFFEKDGHITDLSTLKSRDETKKYLESLFSDSPEVLKELNEKAIEFSFSDKEKMMLVKKYNLLMFSKSESNSTNSSAFFYSNIKRGDNEVLKLNVNDNTEYSIPANRSISVGLSTEHASKICISFDKDEECVIIQGSPFQIKYYEIAFNSVSGKMEVSRVKNTDAQRYLQFALKNKIK